MSAGTSTTGLSTGRLVEAPHPRRGRIPARVLDVSPAPEWPALARDRLLVRPADGDGAPWAVHSDEIARPD
jgi:hypothetical protein